MIRILFKDGKSVSMSGVSVADIKSNDHLNELEQQSIYIIREAYKKFPKLAMLWSMGKDSTVMLWLVRKAFFGRVPFPMVHIDTTFKIPEMIKFRAELYEIS